MREILFRAKRFSDNTWIEGYFYKKTYCDGLGECSYIRLDGVGGVRVIPESVGQYTGLKDRNGKKIFEGDILQRYKKSGKPYIKTEQVYDMSFIAIVNEKEIVGNVHN